MNEEKLVLSGIVNQDGTIAVQGENKILLSLLNIEKETTGMSNAGTGNLRTLSNVAPAMNINIYVLFSAFFSSNNYSEALRFLSFIIGYFQYKSVFTRSNTPKLDPKIGKLLFEMENLSVENLSNIWSTLGAKYMPSVVYKIRMLTFDESVVREFRPAVSGVTDEHHIS